MGIGVGIFLLALGAVLAFAVDASISGLDINTIGVILMICGAIGLALDMLLFAPRRRAVVADTAATYPADSVETTREVRRTV